MLLEKACNMKLTVILYMDHCESTAQAIAALKQNHCFASTQLLIVDPFCTAESAAAVKEASAAEIISLEGASVGQAYQTGLDKATGDVIHFTLGSSVLSRGALDAALRAMRKKDSTGAPARLVALRAKGINNVNNAGSKVNYKMQAKQHGFSNIRFEPAQTNLILQSYFIESALAKSVSFESELGSTAVHAYLLNVLANYYVVYSLQSKTYTYSVLLENSASSCDFARDKDWYTPAVRNFYTPFLHRLKEANGTAPLFLQIATLYLVWAKYNCNFFDRDREVLSKEEAEEFYNATCEFLSYINDNVIFQDIPCNYTMARQLKMLFYRGKCKHLGMEPCNATIIPDGAFENQLVLNNDVYHTYDANALRHVEERADALDLCTMGKIQNQNVRIMVLDYIDGKIELDYEVVTYLLETSDYELLLKIGDDKYYEPKPTEVYSLVKYFGLTIDRRKTFHASIPAEDLLDKRLTFVVRLDGQEYELNLQFPKMASKLLNSNASYCMLGDDKYLAVQHHGLTVRRKKPGQRFFLEAKFFAYRMINTPVPRRLIVKYLFLRLLYWLVYPTYHKKRIWITFDKLYKAGDDGEYMFQYCRKQEDGIEIYYVLNKEAADYERLKQQHGKYVLTQDCMKLKLLALYSEVILASHATVPNYIGFTPKTNIFVRDLFHGIIVCIQHGLTIQKIAQYQNRVFDNTRLYTLASKYEKANVEKPIYGYSGKELKLTGLARYDGLKSNDQKQILITPTWRRNIVNQSIAFVKKSHNDTFKNSEYFRIYNSLINDQTLIDCAKRTGYKLIYLLHPAMSSQAEDFDKNDAVEIVQATGDMSYEKILTESSLMVTDYSGVQFDFAYQRKPIVYYHPDSLPPHYEEGGLIYDTMGFGPICKNHESVVSTLCTYMENGCKMPEEYVKRADDFFYFNDFNNCERIYHEVCAFLKETK